MPEGAVLDEVQRVPQLLSYIQAIVDRSRKPGIFILTGSHQPEVHQAVGQTLAGRIAVLRFDSKKARAQRWQYIRGLLRPAWSKSSSSSSKRMVLSDQVNCFSFSSRKPFKMALNHQKGFLLISAVVSHPL